MSELNQDMSIKELVDSINTSINDIREHPVEADKVPSDLEIMVRGISDSHALDLLFSSGMDKVLERLFNDISSGNFEEFDKHREAIEEITEKVFGPGSFKGPVSQTVLNSIQSTMTSYRYNNMRQLLGKNITQMRKLRMLIKNLNKAKDTLKDEEDIKKYKQAVYAIKKCLLFAAKIYRNRKIINRKVFDGLKNIVHEDVVYGVDEALEW